MECGTNNSNTQQQNPQNNAAAEEDQPVMDVFGDPQTGFLMLFLLLLGILNHAMRDPCTC
eukprot:CAMPEP_0185768444 /NCGR_PEP_ID=MMETSP1174-20130828/49697_1 /TAXON_ID=35687 /ORGANISM="Dictyocha speculum, Strain CCMP1381" /LENGTH=59 /DNA_ID=CAMNT_0028453121 /DNA_START=36 /DNA_END=215 /DNA_ORIENTATION=+